MTTRHPPTTSHNYIPKVRAILSLVREHGAAVDVDVRHEDWCDVLRLDGFCNCDCIVSFRGGAS